MTKYALLAFLFSGIAQAHSFSIDFSHARSMDPVADFPSKCLGAVEDPACPVMAAALRVELSELGVLVTDGHDEETQGLFERIGELNDSRLKAISANYLARNARSLNSEVWSKLKIFLFGEDDSSAYAAAGGLASSSDPNDQRLSAIYLNSHRGEWYEVRGADSASGWVDGVLFQAAVDRCEAWNGQIPPSAARLPLLDTVAVSPYTDDAPLYATGFQTGESYDAVYAYFKRVLGQEAYPPVAELNDRATQVMKELEPLMQAIQHGDYSGVDQYNKLLDEYQSIQTKLMVLQQIPQISRDWTERVFAVTAPDSNGQQKVVRAASIVSQSLDGHVWLRQWGR